MTFGEALRQLQAIYNIKLGNLSDALGYDISYMSKWISGAKLPSAKSAEMTCDRIAAYIAQQNSEENQSLAISKLGIAASSASFENALSDRLYTLYLEQKKSGTVVKAHKIGRNDPCPCGSGKKYKKCCGK